MKNYEKYAEKIKEYKGSDFCEDFVKPYILKSDNCSGLPCDTCQMRKMVWLFEEYEEPEVDWSEVEIDTPILVRDNENTAWVRRHFAKYEHGNVWAWRDSRTSWTVSNDDDMTWWRYAKLANSEEE